MKWKGKLYEYHMVDGSANMLYVLLGYVVTCTLKSKKKERDKEKGYR